MPESHSRVNKRVDRVQVNDDPHERYRYHDPWTGEALSHGIPILEGTAQGNMVRKEVKNFTQKCPECDIPARFNELGEAVCAECGIVCSGGDGLNVEQLVVDAKAAGRITDE